MAHYPITLKVDSVLCYTARSMDNFTLAVVVGDVVMVIAFVLLMVLDKKEAPRPVIEAVKTGKRPA